MHLSSEVSSTTNGLGHEAPSSSYGGSLSSQPLTAELFAERTLEGLLADHPGELVKTGSPHVVSFFYSSKHEISTTEIKCVTELTNAFHARNRLPDGDLTWSAA